MICTIYPPPACPPKSPSLIYLQIAKSDLPSNRLYDLPPLICQVRLTFKLPSLIYPQIVCMIYPPPKSPSPIYPQIVCTIYPPLPKSPSLIYPQIVCTIYPPSNRPILSKISNAHNIMLCFTKVFSAKDP